MISNEGHMLMLLSSRDSEFDRVFCSTIGIRIDRPRLPYECATYKNASELKSHRIWKDRRLLYKLHYKQHIAFTMSAKTVALAGNAFITTASTGASHQRQWPRQLEQRQHDLQRLFPHDLCWRGDRRAQCVFGGE